MMRGVIICILIVALAVSSIQKHDHQKQLVNIKHDLQLCEVENSILKTKARIDARNLLYDQVGSYFEYCYSMVTLQKDKKDKEKYKQFIDCHVSKLQ